MSEAVDRAYRRVGGDPLDRLAQWRATLGADSALLVVDFTLQPWWEAAPPLSLTAIYLHHEGTLLCAVTDQPLVRGPVSVAAQFEHWCAQWQLLAVTPGEPLALRVTPIPKPWGRELWYTGVEQRGVCHFGGAECSVPIPWLQAVLPDAAYGEPGKPLVLLKVLDPSNEEVTGDLYFELHEQKREVYVVTHIDRHAWPDGVGYIRFGFSAQRLAEAGSEAAFRREYRDAVVAYEAVRRRIDGLADPAVAPAALSEEEARLREAMDAFTHRRPLRVGDVVVVPLLMPHSLQHGVRTIEFQTPVYERKILSFAQRVLTQDHWDTDEAVATMRLLPPDMPPFERLPSPEGVACERIVDFEDFEVRRIRIEPGANYRVFCPDAYSLLMGIEGEVTVGEVTLGPERGVIVPAGRAVDLAMAGGAEPLILLQALPRR